MSRSAYGRSKCWICGRVISNAGFAQHSHRMAHVRKGHYRHYYQRRHAKNRRGDWYSYRTHEFEITKKGTKERQRRKDAEWRDANKASEEQRNGGN